MLCKTTIYILQAKFAINQSILRRENLKGETGCLFIFRQNNSTKNNHDKAKKMFYEGKIASIDYIIRIKRLTTS